MQSTFLGLGLFLVSLFSFVPYGPAFASAEKTENLKELQMRIEALENQNTTCSAFCLRQNLPVVKTKVAVVSSGSVAPTVTVAPAPAPATLAPATLAPATLAPTVAPAPATETSSSLIPTASAATSVVVPQPVAIATPAPAAPVASALNSQPFNALMIMSGQNSKAAFESLKKECETRENSMVEKTLEDGSLLKEESQGILVQQGRGGLKESSEGYTVSEWVVATPWNSCR